MKWFGLQQRLILSSGLFLLVLMSVTALLDVRREREGLGRQIQNDGVALARVYALGVENALLLQRAGLARLTGEASRTQGIQFLSIMDANLMVIGHTDPAQIGTVSKDELARRALLSPIGPVLQGRTPLVVFNTDSTGADVFRVIVPLVLLDAVSGVMEIGLDTHLLREASDRTNVQTVLVVLAAFGVGIVLITVFTRGLTKPLRSLARAADRIAEGDLQVSIPVAGSDEIGHLSHAFEAMRAELVTTFANLKDRTDQIEGLRLFSESVLNSINTGVITFDLEGRLTGMNHAAEAILRTSSASVLGHLHDEVFLKWPELAVAISQLAEGSGKHVEVVVSDAPQKSRLLELVGNELKNAAGVRVGRVLALEDISLIRSLEQRLRDSGKMAAMGELAVGIAHEVRNPLGSIRTAAQFVHSKLGRRPQLQRFPQLIVEEVDRLNSLVTRLLRYTRPDDSGVVPVSQPREILEYAAALTELKIAGRPIQLKRTYSDDLQLPVGNPRRLLQAVLNILFNAVDAIPDQGSIHVNAWNETSPATRVAIDVQDDGCGIEEADLARIFDPFFTTRAEGTGLGLSIAGDIVRESGGSIRALSQPGKGTLIQIRLPSRSESLGGAKEKVS